MALSLKIDLEARFAQALDAFDRLEKQAGRSLKRVESSVDGVNNALNAIGVGLSVGALAASFKASIDELASLKDAAEQTGSSVETISAALNTLRAAGGGGLETIVDLTSRFGRSIATVDDDTSRAAQAFKALGLNIDELKSLGRVDAVLEIARAQARFAEDGQKAVLIEEALGRGAAQLIPDLNDLAETTLDAATATGQIADQADASLKSIAAFQAQLIALRNDVAIKVLPPLNELLLKYRAIASLRAGPTDILDSLLGEDQGDRIAGFERRIETLNRIRTELERSGDPSLLQRALNPALRTRDDIDRELVDLAGKLQRAKDIQRRQQEIFGAVGLGQAPEPRASVSVPDSRQARQSAEDAAKSARAAQQARESYAALDELISQSLIDDQLRVQAEAARALAEELDRASRASLQRQEAFDRAEADADEAIRRDIDAIRDAVDPTRALYRELERVRELTSAGLLPADIGNARLMQLYGQIDQILLTFPELTDAVVDSAESMLAPIESAFESMIFQGGKARDVLAGLAQDIAQFILRQQITGPLFEILAGRATSKSVGGTVLGSIFGFAGGGDPPVGRWSLVGEKGPELIRPLSPMRVYPSGMGPAGGGGVNIVQNVSVGAGVNRAEVAAAMYAAKESAKAEILASMRRGSTFAAA
ncbi:MAG: hypothetical protein RL756_600 [Pseudomonadota bacterium]|jgi:hypothetical protein